MRNVGDERTREGGDRTYIKGAVQWRLEDVSRRLVRKVPCGDWGS